MKKSVLFRCVFNLIYYLTRNLVSYWHFMLQVTEFHNYSACIRYNVPADNVEYQKNVKLQHSVNLAHQRCRVPYNTAHIDKVVLSHLVQILDSCILQTQDNIILWQNVGFLWWILPGTLCSWLRKWSFKEWNVLLKWLVKKYQKWEHQPKLIISESIIDEDSLASLSFNATVFLFISNFPSSNCLHCTWIDVW